MKAIEINGQTRIFNRIPSAWGNVQNYNKLDPQQHYDDGFRDVITPSFDNDTQKKGAIYFDEANDCYTYEVIDLTAQQIEDLAQLRLDADDTAQALQQKKADGVKYFDRAIARIERMLNLGELTGAKAKTLVGLIYPALEPLYKGQFLIVKTNLNNLEHPYQEGDVENDFLIEVWDKINKYIQNNP